jgi:hypothetical protein
MSKVHQNPLSRAIRQLNDTVRNYGAFTFAKSRRNPEELRMLLHKHPHVTLLQRVSDLDGDVSSVFVHEPSGTRILLREWTCPSSSTCAINHGAFNINALTMDGLSTVIDILDNDTETIEEFVDTCRGEHMNDFEGEEYE